MLSPAGLAWTLSRGEWIPAKHLRLLNQKLLEVAIGHTPRLIVQMPPRHGKSELISHWFPVWFLEHFPQQRIILTSYEADFAASWGRKVRNTINAHTAELTVRISEDSSAANRWETHAGGGMVTAGVGGPITGRGANILLVDDPIKNAAEADSQTVRNAIWDWWTSTAYTRLEPNAGAIVVMTRWHRDDLAGRLIAQMQQDGEPWEVLDLPALASVEDPLGRVPGAPLWPARYDEQALARIRANISDRHWAALYQQAPTAEGGVIVQRDWFADGRNRYDATDGQLQQRVVAGGRLLSFDTAEETGEGAAYTACVVGELLDDYTLAIRDVWRGRVTIPELPDLVTRLATEHNHDGKLGGVLIEYKSSGKFTYQAVRRYAPPWLKVLKFEPRVDKAARLSAAAVHMRNDMVLLPATPQGASWLPAYESELFSAPNSAWMDQADATSQLIIYLSNFLSQGWHARQRARRGSLELMSTA